MWTCFLFSKSKFIHFQKLFKIITRTLVGEVSWDQRTTWWSTDMHVFLLFSLTLASNYSERFGKMGSDHCFTRCIAEMLFFSQSWISTWVILLECLANWRLTRRVAKLLLRALPYFFFRFSNFFALHCNVLALFRSRHAAHKHINISYEHKVGI